MESDSYIKPFFVIEWIQNVLSTWKYIWSPPVSRNFLNRCWRFYFTSQSGLHYCHVTLCYMLLRDSTIVMSHSVTCCCVLLGVAAQSLKPVKRLSQQLILFLLFCDRRSVVNSRELHVVSLEFTEFYGLYPSHDVLQVPAMLRPFARSLRCGVNLIKLLQV